MSNRLNFENWQTRKKQIADVSRTDEHRPLEWFSDKYQFFGMLERSEGFSIDPLKAKAENISRCNQLQFQISINSFFTKLLLNVSLEFHDNSKQIKKLH
jgi:hypothetical protein